MKHLLIGIVAVTGLIGTPAFAADMALKAPLPPPPPVFSWTGCHVGVDVGGTWVIDKDNETVTATGAPSAFTPYPTNSATPSGVTAGGYAGCDYQFAGGFVLGAEGDGEWANIRGGTANFINTGVPPDTYEPRSDFLASARGRLGYGYNRTLFYATGGAAWTNITQHDVLGGTVTFQDSSATRTGWTVGGGLEYAFLDNLVGRVEYRYSDFGTFSYVPVVTFPGFTENHRITENAVRVGLSYKFGAPLVARY